MREQRLSVNEMYLFMPILEALNLETRPLSLLTKGPLIMREQRLSVNEMCVIMPILEALNLEIRQLALLTEGPLIMREQRLSVNEMCVIMPILEALNLEIRQLALLTEGPFTGGPKPWDMATGIEAHPSCAFVAAKQVTFLSARNFQCSRKRL